MPWAMPPWIWPSSRSGWRVRPASSADDQSRMLILPVAGSTSTRPRIRAWRHDTSMPVPPRGSSAHDDHALLGHLADREVGSLAGVPGLLGAAVGHLVDSEGGGLVDGHAAEVQALGRGQRDPQVLGVDAGLQAVLGVVGQLERLVDVLERPHRDDRAEDLVAPYLV